MINVLRSVPDKQGNGRYMGIPYIYIYIHMYMYACAFVYVYIYIYICMHRHTNTCMVQKSVHRWMTRHKSMQPGSCACATMSTCLFKRTIHTCAFLGAGTQSLLFESTLCDSKNNTTCGFALAWLLLTRSDAVSVRHLVSFTVVHLQKTFPTWPRGQRPQNTAADLSV